MAYIKVDDSNQIIFINNQVITDNLAIQQLMDFGCFYVEGTVDYTNYENVPSNKTELLYWDFEGEKVVRQFIDTPLNSEQRIEQLEQQLIAQQEQFQIELAESNTQMFELIMTMQGGLE